jgi:hypothetical protein
MQLLLSYIAGQLGATLDTLLAGIQSNPSVLKAFCKLTLTPGITERSKAVRFAKQHAMRTARASAIWGHRSDLAWVRRRARMEPADHRDPDQVCRLRDDTDLWPDRGRSERYGTRPACVAEDAYPRPGLSRELPPDLPFVSGLDATAHAAEGAVFP